MKKILRFISGNDHIKDHLVLKGGTAINLAIFNLPRLSVDIDLDYAKNDPRDEMLEARAEITELIKRYMGEEGYHLSNSSRFSHSLDSFHFQYENSGGNRDMIKIEINYSLRAHVLLPMDRLIIPEAFNDGTIIHMLDPMEIFAAKGNALITRAAARDLYDWGNMIKAGLFSNDINTFRKCFIFYASISTKNINKAFDTSAIDSLTINKIKRDLFPVINIKEDFKLAERQQEAKEYINELMQLTDAEKEYLERFEKKEYKPELLFEDEEILNRIRNHPMALWKCSKLSVSG